MRIVIDMQGAQTESRFRGIGRYSMGFAEAVARNRGEHELILVLSGMFPGTIEPIRASFEGLLPPENIRVWYAPGPVKEQGPGNEARREIAELIREAFLASLLPDVIHITSLFEGYVDDAVTSLGRFDTTTPVSVLLHDLIPLLNPDQYLTQNATYRTYYLRKVEWLKKADMLLANSDFTRQEGIEHLGNDPERVVNVSTAGDDVFKKLTINEADACNVKQNFGITRPFVLYTGGADARKNLPRLILAYAKLSEKLRASHQLVFAGKIPEGDISHLKHEAHRAGLKGGELLFTGYVSDQELVHIYNLCTLYVFPSWHEGFGLPALEAMACGAPVIGANTSSLPEVIGLSDALFDPFDVAAITEKLMHALSDERFLTQLRVHGLQQAKKFSWDETAKRAIRAWAGFDSEKRADIQYLSRSLSGKRLLSEIARHVPRSENGLIAVARSLAQNERAGIERQLMLDVSELCQRDAGTGVQRVVRSYLKWLLAAPPEGFRVEPVYATRENGYRYARVFTQNFLELDSSEAEDSAVNWQRGDLFFGLDMQHHVQLAHSDFYQRLTNEGVTVKFLVHDLLPIELPDLFTDSDARVLHEQWLSIIGCTDEAICISNATSDAFEKWLIGAEIKTASTFRTSWVHIGGDIQGSKPTLGLPADAEKVLEMLSLRPTFLCISTIEPRKMQPQVLDAIELLWQDGLDLNLVFVGKQGWKTEAFTERLCTHTENNKRLFWLAGISDEYLEKIYSASTCLIAASINEGFGLSLIEAARHGIPVIARDIPVFREVAGEHAYYFQGEDSQALAKAVKEWMALYRTKEYPDSSGMHWSTWQQSAEKLKFALVKQNYRRKQLMVDISELVQHDAKTGIQRVVRNILREWLSNPPDGYHVEPVYATLEHGYRYARKFTGQFLNGTCCGRFDERVDFAPGDLFFGLDLQPQVQVVHREFYRRLRGMGVTVRFMVYDLLCVLMPEHFPEGAKKAFSQWLNVVSEGDGVICISKAVADEFTYWDMHNGSGHHRSFSVDWFHLGADIDKSCPSTGLPSDAEKRINQFRSRPSFLIVGTIEPRKAHAQVLDAFDIVWNNGLDVNLVFVGKDEVSMTCIGRFGSSEGFDRNNSASDRALMIVG